MNTGKLLQALYLIAALAFLSIYLDSPIVSALSPEQKRVYDSGINYFDVNTCNSSTSSTTTGTPSMTGGVAFDDSQSVDTGYQTTIDDDGIDPSPIGSSDHQSQTAYANSKLGALHTNYFALNPGWAAAHGITLGDVGALTYQGKTIYAVYGDNHVGNTVHSEISVKAAMALTSQTNPKAADSNSLKGVHTVVYPNTHQLLNGSINQSKIDQVGAQVSGGSSPGSSASSTPIGSCCDSSTQLTGNTNAEKVWNYFIGKGLSNTLVAAIMGNFEIESGFDPTVYNVNQHTNDPNGAGSYAWGLAQWLPATKIFGIQQQSGVSGNIYDLATQLDIVWWEASTNNSPSGGWDFSAFKAITSVDDATTYWQNHFEGSPGQADQARLNSAHKWLGYASGSGISSPGTPSPGSTSGSCSSPSSSPSNGYQSPFHSENGLVRSRVDEGVDYATSGSNIPIYPIGNAKITQATSNSNFYIPKDHAPTSWITYQLSDGPAKGKYVYVAEFCFPVMVHITQTVAPNDKLCNVEPRSIETGWAINATSQAAAAHGTYSEGHATAYGQNFEELMDSLSVATKACYDHPGESLEGSLPSGWPAWVTNPATRAGSTSCN
jgi:Phage tail lysozyme